MSACRSFWGEKIPDTTPTLPAKPNREKSATTRKEKQLQQDPEKRAREEEERTRTKEERVA
jgi:hypothetical protein